MLQKRIRQLPDGELAVMQALWNCKLPASRRDMEVLLADTHPMAATTLLTILTRLSEKGFLTIEKQGRTALYTPTVSREAYLAAQGDRFFHQLCGGSLPAFASALCDSGLTREELEELRQLLDRGDL